MDKCKKKKKKPSERRQRRKSAYCMIPFHLYEVLEPAISIYSDKKSTSCLGGQSGGLTEKGLAWTAQGIFFFFLAVPWACGISVPDQGRNPCPLQWKCRVLTTGPPGKSLGGLKNRNLSHSFGGQKSKVKVLAGLIPSEGFGENLSHASLLTYGGLLTVFGVPWL